MSERDTSYDNDRVPLPNLPGEPIDLTNVTVTAPPGFTGTIRVSNNWPLSEAVSGKVWVVSDGNIKGVYASSERAEDERKRLQDIYPDNYYEVTEHEVE